MLKAYSTGSWFSFCDFLGQSFSASRFYRYTTLGISLKFKINLEWCEEHAIVFTPHLVRHSACWLEQQRQYALGRQDSNFS